MTGEERFLIGEDITDVPGFTREGWEEKAWAEI
jgi:hypothetical protein